MAKSKTQARKNARQEAAKKAAPRVVPSAKKAATPPLTIPKKTAQTKEEAEKDKALSPSERIDYVMSQVNTAFGANVIRRANHAVTSHTLRRPTGIPDLDIGLAGGFPAGALSVVTGPDGAGKDYIINCCIREIQRNYGEETRVAILSTEFPYDKKFAREQAGVRVGFTEEEINDLNENRIKAGVEPLSGEESEEYMAQTGDIVLIQGVLADHAFDIVLNLIDTGAFQFIAINSLGVLETVAKDDTDSLEEHAVQSSEAQLLARFIPKMFGFLNRELRNGQRNETTLLAANQVRANRDMPRARPGMPVPQHLKYQPGSGSRALAHGKAIDLMLHKGPSVLDKTYDPPLAIGRTINWELSKGKLGTHDGVKGSYDYFYNEGADLASSLLAQATLLEVIEQSGAWYSYDDGEIKFRAQGGIHAAEALRDPAVYARVYQRTIAAAKIYCRYT